MRPLQAQRLERQPFEPRAGCERGLEALHCSAPPCCGSNGAPGVVTSPPATACANRPVGVSVCEHRIETVSPCLVFEWVDSDRYAWDACRTRSLVKVCSAVRNSRTRFRSARETLGCAGRLLRCRLAAVCCRSRLGRFLFCLVGHMMADRTACSSTDKAMVAGEMTAHAANRCPF